MFDVITFGSAARDIHLKTKSFKILDDSKDFVTGKGICLPFGSKIDVDKISFTSGGGGTNVAATFALQGLKTAYCGAIGVDIAGLEIIRELRHYKIDTRFLVKRKEKHTNHSIVFSSGENDRTILVYRGASDLLCDNDIAWKKIKKTKWFYLAPLADTTCQMFARLVDFAKENNIKVACNPSKQQLALNDVELERIFAKIDVLFLNQEEASLLTKIDYEKENEIFKKLDELCPGVAVMTKGGDGVVASDGKYLYSALPNPGRKIVDTTGAGDSFGSGFMSEFVRHNGNIEKAIQFGLANSEGNLSEVGAKTGLLAKNAKYTAVKVTKQLCTENNLCLPK